MNNIIKKCSTCIYKNEMWYKFYKPCICHKCLDSDTMKFYRSE